MQINFERIQGVIENVIYLGVLSFLSAVLCAAVEPGIIAFWCGMASFVLGIAATIVLVNWAIQR